MSYESNPFAPAQESACIAKVGASVVRRGGALRLKFNNGASRTYTDSTAAACKKGPYDNCKNYMLYDYFPEHGLFLVNVGYNESQQWLLVSQKDGKQVQVVAQPGYSPGRKWLASVYWTEGPDDGNNGVDIVPANFDLIGSAFHYRPTEYELWEDVGWDGDDRLLLNVTWHPGGDPTGELATWPAEAVRVMGAWRLNRWAPGSLRP